MVDSLGVPGITDPVEIGRGGFGVVYRATETDLRRNVAVKMLRSGLDEQGKERFDRERQAMGSLSGHPNIVTVYRSGFTDENRAYIVMEYLDEGSMDDHIRTKGPVEWREAARIGIDVAGALESAHRAGVLHRDIKPGNILMSSTGQTKLGDFGIARIAGSPETTSSTVTASVAHAAPEVIDGVRPSPSADVYSLASTLYELTVGTAPFVNASDETMVAMIARIARDPVPSHTSIPAGLFEVLSTAMAKDPEDRHPSASAFGEALSEALDADGLAPTPGPVVVETTTFATVVADLPDDPTAAPEPAPPATEAPPAAGAPPAAPSLPPPVPATDPSPMAPAAQVQRLVANAAGATTDPPPGPPSAPATGRSTSGSPNPKIIGAAIAGLAVIIGIVVFAITRSGGDEEPLRQPFVATTPATAEQPTTPVDQPTTPPEDPTAAPTTPPAEPTPVVDDGLPQIQGDDYPQYTTISDFTGAIRVDVPQEWGEIDDGATGVTPTLLAAPSLIAAANTFDTPGVLISVQPGPLVDAQPLLDAISDASCTVGADRAYEDPLYQGVIRTNTNCGLASSTIWLVVASPPSGEFIAVVAIQALTPRDETAARRILDSFVVDGDLL